MSTTSYRCPWCDATRTEPCVHVKEVEFGKDGLIKRIVFRDLADMPFKAESEQRKYSLKDLDDAPDARSSLFPMDDHERAKARRARGL